jgi:V/A-type H+-transporting ATPase subunit D
MAVLKINPNRMELSRLKSRLKIAKKGHKLLKDKQEQLIRNFFNIIDESKTLRKEVDASLIRAYQSFSLAKAIMGEEKIESAIMAPTLITNIVIGERQIMNLKVPTFDIDISGDPLSYSPIESSVELDEATSIFAKVIQKLLALAEIEKSIVELANEIIGTRRRVNALEYILIPNLQETIRAIQSKLSEMERSNIVKLMFVK